MDTELDDMTTKGAHSGLDGKDVAYFVKALYTVAQILRGFACC